MIEEQRQQFIEDARIELIRSHVYRDYGPLLARGGVAVRRWVIFPPYTDVAELRQFERLNPDALLVHGGSTDRTL